jgi:hypothetical protein
MLLLLERIETRTEQMHGRRAVLVLTALVLAGDDHARGQMGDADRGVGDVDVLTARARRAVSVDAQVLVVDVHFDRVVDVGHGHHRRERGVTALGRVER